MSRAFPDNADAIKHRIYRQPYAVGWLREHDVYGRCPNVKPEWLSQAYYAGRALIWRQVPGDTLWVLPHDGDWAALDAAAKEGRAAL